MPVDQALELLDFNFPDNKVRKYGVNCLQELRYAVCSTKYWNFSKFLGRYAEANSAYPDQTDLGLHYLPFYGHLLKAFHYSSGKSLRVKLTHSNLYLYSKNEVRGGQEKNQ